LHEDTAIWPLQQRCRANGFFHTGLVPRLQPVRQWIAKTKWSEFALQDQHGLGFVAKHVSVNFKKHLAN
jgi:hypothetical protein